MARIPSTEPILFPCHCGLPLLGVRSSLKLEISLPGTRDVLTVGNFKVETPLDLSSCL